MIKLSINKKKATRATAEYAEKYISRIKINLND